LETLDKDDPKNRASLRIKILIKNLFDNKQSGWAKSKADQKTIKTKQEVEDAVKKQEAEKRQLAGQERDAPNSQRGQRNNDRDRDDYRDGNRLQKNKSWKEVNNKQEKQQYRARGDGNQTPKGQKRYNDFDEGKD